MSFSTTNSRGQTYYLHGKNITLKNGHEQRIYYFARQPQAETLDAVPSGYTIAENAKTGLPVLKKAG